MQSWLLLSWLSAIGLLLWLHIRGENASCPLRVMASASRLLANFSCAPGPVPFAWPTEGFHTQDSTSQLLLSGLLSALDRPAGACLGILYARWQTFPATCAKLITTLLHCSPMGVQAVASVDPFRVQPSPQIPCCTMLKFIYCPWATSDPLPLEEDSSRR